MSLKIAILVPRKSQNIIKLLLTILLGHLSHWLMVNYCDGWMSVVPSLRAASVMCHQQLLQITSPPKLLAGF